MSNKKVAGLERPYSPRKLGELLCDYIVQGGFDNSAKLDYFSPSYDDETEIKKETFEIYSITDFGSNEGIYTSFYIEYPGEKRIRLMCAKTLGESKEDYVNMHVMAANICYSFIKFVNRNLDSFIWYGYYLYYAIDKGVKKYCWCHSIESVYNNADDILQKHPNARVYYIDCQTRKKFWYNF